MISIFLLIITFSSLSQCGQRIQKDPSELNTASLNIIFVQCGQLPTPN